ncbi:MAG: MFS transporter, partial [Thermoleophilia bacterium]|nr:MFS transporter [Gaiellaceae bacterium]MDW8338930.1 MFS transporter [Thermoleophilia bacterium]
TVAVSALALAGLAALGPHVPPQELGFAALVRAVGDRRFLGALWLQTLPAMLFGVLVVLAPLALDARGWTALGIAVVFVAAGVVEVVLNPLLGRVSDQVGRLLPVRAALAASTVVALGLALGSHSAALAALVLAAGVSFGALYTPSMALASDRAELAGLAQGLAFGLLNSAWAVGELVGPSLAGYLADAYGDGLPWALGAFLCALTLTASLTERGAGAAAHEA